MSCAEVLLPSVYRRCGVIRMDRIRNDQEDSSGFGDKVREVSEGLSMCRRGTTHMIDEGC